MVNGHCDMTSCSPRRNLRSALQWENAASIVATNPMTTSATPMWIAASCKRTACSLCVACRIARKKAIIPNPKVAKVNAVRIQARVVRSSESETRNFARLVRSPANAVLESPSGFSAILFLPAMHRAAASDGEIFCQGGFRLIHDWGTSFTRKRMLFRPPSSLSLA